VQKRICKSAYPTILAEAGEMGRSPGKAGATSQLRIIGGQWRGRKLAFAPAPGLRPTPDRVRETLFNWLAPFVHGARCADLFAGSGALGLEALSRGAAYCDFVDSSERALRRIESHLGMLDARESGQCHAMSALQFLQRAESGYDIVFVDPPFDSDLLAPACALLAGRRLLNEGGLVYTESAAGDSAPLVQPGWNLHREKRAGGVGFRLFIVARGQIV
jgi:16S rRNA (guanine966-N2)-methyltransferase